jgi:hypothetical protein
MREENTVARPPTVGRLVCVLTICFDYVLRSVQFYYPYG